MEVITGVMKTRPSHPSAGFGHGGGERFLGLLSLVQGEPLDPNRASPWTLVRFQRHALGDRGALATGVTRNRGQRHQLLFDDDCANVGMRGPVISTDEAETYAR